MDKKNYTQNIETVTEEEIYIFNDEEFQKLLDSKPWESE
jgi:hypothetical protein